MFVGVDAVPASVVVPTEAVLVHEPGGREGVAPDLLPRDLRGLEGRGNHDQSVPLAFETLPGRGEGGGLAGAGSALDDDQSACTEECGDDVSLALVELSSGDDGADLGWRPWVLGSRDQAGDDVGLDGEDVTRGERADVVGYVVALQERARRCDRASGEVLPQFASYGAVDDHTDVGDDPFALSAEVGGVPAGASGSEPRQREFGHGVAVDPGDRRRGRDWRARVSKWHRGIEAEAVQLVDPPL